MSGTKQTLPSSLNKYRFFDELKRLPFVKKVILFGSRARGSNQSRADIDIAIVCPAATIHQWAEILDIIDAADTLLPIDCVRFDTADAEFQQKILRDGIEV
jgi:predicted nucleotidyltransferase